MTENLDAGDIIAAHPISLSEKETFETYAFKASKTALSVLEQVTNDLANIWTRGLPQDEKNASYWNEMQDKERTISLNSPGEKIVGFIKSLGSQGAILEIGSHKYRVRDCSFLENVKIDRHLENIFIYENDFFISAECTDGVIIIPRMHSEQL
jgi:methionyl-tRNA formyltransferase